MFIISSIIKTIGFFLAMILVQNNLKIARKNVFYVAFIFFIIFDIFVFEKGYFGFLNLVVFTFVIQIFAFKNSNFKSILNTGVVIGILLISRVVTSIWYLFLEASLELNNFTLLRMHLYTIVILLFFIFVGRHLNIRIKKNYFVSNSYYARLILIDSISLFPVFVALNYIYRYLITHLYQIIKIESLEYIFIIFLFILIIVSFVFMYVMNIFLLSKKKYRIMLSEADYDELTQVFNRKSGMRKIKELYSQNKVFKNNFVICFLDVNNLKLVNDRFGHPEGDELIKTVSGVVKSSLRDVDFMVRYGGDEFIIIFQNCNIDDAKNAWKRIRGKFEVINYRLEKPYRISVSVGFASMDEHPDFNAEELIDIADVRMYRNKRIYKSQISQNTNELVNN